MRKLPPLPPGFELETEGSLPPLPPGFQLEGAAAPAPQHAIPRAPITEDSLPNLLGMDGPIQRDIPGAPSPLDTFTQEPVRAAPGLDIMDVNRIATEEALQRNVDAKIRDRFEVAANPATLADYGRAYAAGVGDFAGDALNFTNRAGNRIGDLFIGEPLHVLGGPDIRSGFQERGNNFLHNIAEGIRGEQNAGFQALQADNQWGIATDEDGNPVGSGWNPRNWTLGDDPSVAGFMSQGMGVLGSLAPVIAASLLTGGATAPALIGGMGAGGAGAREAEEAIDSMWAEGTLMQESSRFRELVEAGADPEAAYQQVRKDAGDWAGAVTGAIGGAGGAVTGKILSPTSRMFGRLPTPVRVPAVLAASQAEEVVQETAEGVGGALATNLSAGTSLPLDADIPSNVIGGAFGGTATGTIAARQAAGRQQRLALQVDRLNRVAQNTDAPMGDRLAALMELNELGITLPEESFAPGDPNHDYRINPNNVGLGPAPVGAVARDMEVQQTPTHMQVDGVPDADIAAQAQAIVDSELEMRRGREVLNADATADAPAPSITPNPAVSVDGAPVPSPFYQSAEDSQAALEPTTADGALTRRQAAEDIPTQASVGDAFAQVPDTTQLDDGDGDGWTRRRVPSGRVDKRGRPLLVPELRYDRGDGLLEYLAAAGGVNYESIRKASNADPKSLTESTVRNPLGMIGYPAMRKDGGMTLDQLYDSMHDDGWFPGSVQGGVTESEAATQIADMVAAALNGEHIPHPTQGAEARAAREEVQRENDARYQLEQELRWLDEAAAENAAATADMRQRAALEIAEADGAEARSIYELARQSAEAGIPAEQVAQQDGEADGAYASRLWRLNQGESRGADQGTAERDSGPSVQGPRGRAAVEAADEGGSRPRAGTPETGLFGAPTAREQVDGEARARADRRDGRTGGVTPSFSGTPLGALGAGPAPAQADVEDGETASPAPADPEHRGPRPHPKSSAPEHVIPERGVVPLSVEQIAEVAREWRQHIDQGGQAEITRVFDAPEKGERVRTAEKVRVHTKEHGWMTLDEAKARVAEWRANAQSQNGKANGNAQKVVLSLFDKTGAWAEPWADAGYQVYTFDIQNDPDIGDVNNFSVEHFVENFGMFEGNDVYAILAACPCTDFAVSGARHFAAKDADGRTQLSTQLVQQTLATVEYFKPPVWAIENPVGRIEKLGGLPPWRLAFDPHHVGPHPYTKRTQVWGRFNADLPIAPVEPTEGSKMHSQFGGRSQATKDARSETPEGFAYAFFQANNAVDNPVMARQWQWERLDPALVQESVEAGVTDSALSDAEDPASGMNFLDAYYEYDDRAADGAMRAAIEEATGEPAKAPPHEYPGYEDAAPESTADADADSESEVDAALYSDAEITEAADTERDELKRKRKAKTKKKAGKPSVTRDEAPLAYELDIFLDNGYTEMDVADMTPQGKATVAGRIVKQTFGFQRVDIANNLNTLTAINQLTFAYANLQSMAAVMAWPSEAVGKLVPHLALVRGGGNALASYSPGESMIRMSEQHDTFAHEFAHGLDWWVWKTMKLVDPATGEPKGRAATGKLKLGGELTNRPIEQAFVALNEAMFSDQGDAAMKIASIEKHILVVRNLIAQLEARADAATDPAREANIREAIEKRKAHITRLANQITDIKAKPKPNYKADSDYYLNARLLDKAWGTDGGGSDGGYWQRPTEMFARAFEAWVADKVERAGGSTEFLGRTDAGYLETSVDFIAKAYPQQLDRDRVFLAIDSLMDAVRDDVLHGLDGKPMATAQSPDPIPPRAYATWVPKKAEPFSLTRAIRNSIEEAKIQRARLTAHDKPALEAAKRTRDARNPGESVALDMALRAHDFQRNASAGLFATIGGVMRTMEARYPDSKTIKQVSNIFATHHGSGEQRGETYEEFKGRFLNAAGGRLGTHVRKHKLHKWKPKKLRQLRDAMVDHREGSDRPTYPDDVLAAAADLRTFMDEMWMEARNAGFEIGYTKNGYLSRTIDEHAVSGDQEGFIKKAGQVYAEVFESEVGKLDAENLGAIAEAGRQVILATDPIFRRYVGHLNAAARAERDGDGEAGAKATQAAMDLLENGLYQRIKDGWADAAANDWIARILGTVATGQLDVQTAQGSFMKSRALPPSADIIMSDFMVTDPMELIGTYVTSVANRLTFEKFIPKVHGSPDASPAARISALQAKMRDEGVLSSDVEELSKSIELITGFYKTSMTRSGMRRMAWIQAIYTPVVLGRAMMSQLTEVGTTGLVTHRGVRDVGQAFVSQAADLAAVMTEQTKFLRSVPGVGTLLDRADARSAWMHEFAAFTGAVSDSHFDYIMANRTNLLYGNPRAATSNSNFYRYSGIHPHTMSIRRAATERSIHYIKRIAAKAQKGDKAAKRDLNDLGIDSTNEALVKYLADEMSTRPSVMEVQASEHAQAVIVAVNRFVDRVSQNPKMVDKPRLASTPERAYMYVVMAFSSAFTQNIVMAEARKLRARRREDGLPAAAKYAAGMGVGLSVFLGLHTLQYLFRVLLFAGPQGLDDELERWKENPSEAYLTILTRSGLATFGGDPILNAWGGFKYDRSLTEMGAGAYLGKAVGWTSNVGRRVARNAPGTNTAEHAIVRESWDGLAAPVIARYILSRHPWATPALAWTSSPAMKEKVADTLVGPRDSKKKKSGKATDNRRQGRQNRRGESRGDRRGNSRNRRRER